jgi:hypothetical protein
VGTNKRFAAFYDREWVEKNNAKVMAEGQPLSLTDIELELHEQPLTKPPKPIDGKAWVRYGNEAIRIEVSIVAWTPYAVAVKWKTPTGEHHAWVWSSAVH